MGGLASRRLDVCGPVYSVSYGFSTAEKHRERPEPFISFEYLLDFVYLSHIIWGYIWFTYLIPVLNGGLIGCSQENVEP